MRYNYGITRMFSVTDVFSIRSDVDRRAGLLIPGLLFGGILLFSVAISFSRGVELWAKKGNPTIQLAFMLF